MNVLKAFALWVSLLYGLSPCAQTIMITSRSATLGVPFSAESISETVQTLADGNRIRQEQRGKIYRDSQGRTRNESIVNLGRAAEIVIVNIDDPVAHIHISYDVNANSSKQATVTKINVPNAERVREAMLAAQSAAKMRGKSDEQGCRLPEGFQLLEDKTIEGFVVRGEKSTHTVKAGEIGNEKPIVTTIEHWFSEDLGQDLLSESDDPRMGHQTTKLVNIQIGEPDPSLFQVPAGYTVKEQTQE